MIDRIKSRIKNLTPVSKRNIIIVASVVIFVVLIVVPAIIILFMGNDNDYDNEYAEADDNDLRRVAFITQSTSNESQAFAWEEFQRLAPEFGFDSITLFDGDNDPQVEYDGIMTAVTNGYDVIFVYSGSIEDIVPALQVANDSGVVVAMFTSVLPDEHRGVMTFFVGAYDNAVDMQAGEFVPQHITSLVTESLRKAQSILDGGSIPMDTWVPVG